MLTDTPRTDAKEAEVRRQRASVRAYHAFKLARALERELAQAHNPCRWPKCSCLPGERCEEAPTKGGA